MEDLSKRVPMINELILDNLDDKSLINFKEASREINQILDRERFYWIRTMNKHKGNFKEFKKSWKKVISKTPVGNVKQLALAVHHFFKGISTRHETQWHPLFIAAEQGSLELCEHIIGKTGEQNPKRIKDGFTPVHMAAQEGHMEIYQFLVENLDDKNPSENDGGTPLHRAASNGHLEICRITMEALVDKNPIDNEGWTPLHQAAQEGHLKICIIIMNGLVDKNPGNNNGWTPLHAAAKYGHLQTYNESYPGQKSWK